MRIVRSRVLRLLNAREASLVVGSSPRSLTELSLGQLRRRADEARGLHARWAEVASRRSSDRGAEDPVARQAAVDAEARAELFGEAASRYGRALERREQTLRTRRKGKRPRSPRGVVVMSMTGERVAPSVTAGREIRIRKPRRR